MQNKVAAIERQSKRYMVAISAMRTLTAGVTQRPINQSWVAKIAAAFDGPGGLDAIGIPVLNRRESVYWIVDGQHRIKALIKRGFGDYQIECEVFEDLSDKEMAALFLARSNVKNIRTFDKFLIAVTAEEARATDILRIVESNGCKVSRRLDTNCVSAVTSLIRVYDTGGGTVLGQTTRTLRVAYDGEAKSFDGRMIEALGGVYNRFNGRTNEKTMMDRLAKSPHGTGSLYRKAEAIKLKTGHPTVQCLSAAIVDTYNRGLPPKNRLPNWWKSATEESE
jgi:Family of unknown function (DUF6551)